MSVAWSRSRDNVAVTGYDVLLNGTPRAKTTATSFALQQLACGTGYRVGVDAYDAAGNKSSPTSTTVSTSPCVDVTAPSAPTGVQLLAATDSSAVLSWTPSTDDVGVVEYGLYLSGLVAGTGLLVGRVSEASATLSNLDCGTTYGLGIDAADAAGNRSTRGTATFTTPACVDKTPPSAPSALAVTGATQDQIAVKWTASTDNVGVTGYGRYVASNQVGSNTTTVATFGSLQCGTTYVLGIDATDAAGNRSTKSTMSAATAACSETPPATGDKTAPTAPQSLGVSSATQSAITLSWGSASDNVGVTNYRVYRDGTMIGQGPGSGGGYTNTWTDSSRTCGTSYQYAVEAQDAAGNTGPRRTVTAATAACSETPPATGDTTAPTRTAEPRCVVGDPERDHAELGLRERQRRSHQLPRLPRRHDDRPGPRLRRRLQQHVDRLEPHLRHQLPVRRRGPGRRRQHRPQGIRHRHHPRRARSPTRPRRRPRAT